MTVVLSFLTRFHKGCGLVVETRENGRYRWVWMCQGHVIDLLVIFLLLFLFLSFKCLSKRKFIICKANRNMSTPGDARLNQKTASWAWGNSLPTYTGCESHKPQALMWLVWLLSKHCWYLYILLLSLGLKGLFPLQ